MSRGKIIVVEDERDIREGLRELLVRDACRRLREVLPAAVWICTCSM